MRWTALIVVTMMMLAWDAPAAEQEIERLRDAVADVERTFAKTMADRDSEAFASFLADEAVFLSGDSELRRKAAVAAHWTERFFATPEAPFSWAPETVTVLDSGGLALSTGPVWDGEGNRVATFTSIWRQEASGVWRIVFDKGNRYCE